MNKKQYTNIINRTLKYSEDLRASGALTIARAIFKNMGVSLPQGGCKEVFECLKQNCFMAWRTCSLKDAQEFVNNGIAAIGINEDRIVVLSPETTSETDTFATAVVLSLSEDTVTSSLSKLQFYGYFSGSGTGTNTTTIPTVPSTETSTPKYNKDYLGNDILTERQLAMMKENKIFYQNTAAKYDIPWQILAVLHCRENNFSRYSNTGDGPYQVLNSGYTQEYFDDELFQTATDDAAEHFISNVPNIDLNVDDNVKYAFFRYNGASKKYKQQALALGFSEAEAEIGEGSPYVMNRADSIRDPTVEPTKSNNTWGQIKRDYGPLEYPANDSYGAFVIFKAL